MRASEYPVPDYAAYVWYRGDSLVVQCSDGHTLAIPLAKLAIATTESGQTRGDVRGWEFLLTLLRDRYNAVTFNDNRGIGTKSDPVRHDMQRALRGFVEERERSTTVEEDIFAND